MLQINKVYVTDNNMHPIAVQLDIKTFEKIEELLEDYALGKFIDENDPNDALSLTDAKKYYDKLTGPGKCK
jgi:homoserine acetyltransferase